MTSKLTAKKAEKLFIIVSCIELFMGLLRMCELTLPFSRYLLWIFTLFYAAVAAVKQYTIRQKVVFAILLAFGILLYINTGLNKGIRAVIYLYALKDIDMRIFIKSMLGVMVISTIIFAVASKVGLIGHYTVMDIRPYRGFNGLRYSFGYINPNRTMAVVFLALICELILYYDKQPWYGYALVTAVFILLYYLIDSRTAFIVGLAVIGGMWCVSFFRWDKLRNLLFILFIMLFTMMLVISVMAAFRVENSCMDRINHFISGRMSQLTKYTCDEIYDLPYAENWRLFGSAKNHNDYDLGYVQIFYYYGIVPAICYLSCVVCAAVKSWRDKCEWKLIPLIALSVYLFMESVYFSNFIPVDFLLVYSVSLLWGDYGEKTKDEVFNSV